MMNPQRENDAVGKRAKNLHLIEASPQAENGRPFRIVHLATRLIVAGMGHVIGNLVRNMPSHPWHQAVWCLEEADQFGERLRSEGHEVVELGRRSRRDFALILRTAIRLRKTGVHVLHCHDELSWFYGTLAARLAGSVPVVVTMHGRRPDISPRHLLEQRFLACCSDKIVGVSSYLRSQLIEEIKVSPKKVLTIYNGIALPEEPIQELRIRARKTLGLSDQDIVVGSVGRLAPVKNFELLIEAAAKAAVRLPSLRLVLIGEGPSAPGLVQKAQTLRRNGLVRFTGLRLDVEDLLPALDIYVCSSDYEGISLSILEAMAAGRAVIATAVGGNTEIILHGQTGLLVAKGDGDGLAGAIERISSDELLRHGLAQGARRLVEAHFRVEQMIDGYCSLYHELLNSHCEGRPARIRKAGNHR